MIFKPEMNDPAVPFEVRGFERCDVPQLLDLMRDLAAFEDYLEAFAIEEVDLVERGLGANPQFQAKVAVSADGEVVGMAVFYIIPYTYDLRPDMVLKEFYVRPDHRGAGIAEALFKAVQAAAISAGCKRVKWLVLPNNDRAKAFYTRMGATRDEAWENWQLSIASKASKPR